MHRISLLVAAAAATALAAVGFVRGTYAAGGSDSSCYALMAEAFASGQLQPTSALISQVPWPDAPKRSRPAGLFRLKSTRPAFAPVCAPGFSVLLAPVVAIGGRDALFWVTPVAGALLVWMAFLAGRALGGPLAGTMAAVLIAISPPVLYQVVQPMNDITTAALWMAVFVALIQRRWALAGVCCGLALLVRPESAAAGGGRRRFVVVSGFTHGSVIPEGAVTFAIAALPFALIVLWLNHELYGSPLAPATGSSAICSASRSFRATLRAIFAGSSKRTRRFRCSRSPRRSSSRAKSAVMSSLAIGLIAATFFIYLIYTPFDDWSYLRFLLPAIALMLVLASAVLLLSYGSMSGSLPGYASRQLGASGERAGCLVRGRDRYGRSRRLLRAHGGRAPRVRPAVSRAALSQRRNRRARSTSRWCRRVVRVGQRSRAIPRTQGSALVGGSRSRMARSQPRLARAAGAPALHPRRVVGRAGVPRVALRNHSDIGKLDWPPKYEIDRVVRIYDPQDRARYHRGEHVNTEYLWPLRR